MSARSVVKTSYMNASMQEFAINAAQDAIANFTTEQEIASSIKLKFEHQFPSTWVKYWWFSFLFIWKLPILLMGLLEIGTIVKISQKECIMNPENPCFWRSYFQIAEYLSPLSLLQSCKYSTNFIIVVKLLHIISPIFSYSNFFSYYRWHCFIGRNFGCVVTHDASKFIYFYIGQMGICLFATAWLRWRHPDARWWVRAICDKVWIHRRIIL